MPRVSSFESEVQKTLYREREKYSRICVHVVDDPILLNSLKECVVPMKLVFTSHGPTLGRPAQEPELNKNGISYYQISVRNRQRLRTGLSPHTLRNFGLQPRNPNTITVLAFVYLITTTDSEYCS